MTLREGDGWRVRLATRDDNDALCALLRRVPLDGGVALAQDRAPDFFRLADAHAPGVMETVVAETDAGEVIGCGTTVVREGWFPGGARGRVGYVCDLRILPAWRGARLLPAMGRAAFERARDAHGAHVLTAALADGNRRAVRATTGRRPGREEQPLARPMTRYHMVTVPFLGPRRRAAARADVRPATRVDVDELVAFLARRQRTRTFGHVFDRKLLETRLASWPGLSLEDFLLLRDRAGRLVGCAAPWDPSPLRRHVVLGYRGVLRAYRAAYDAWASLRGAARLPAPGEAFRLAFLSHLEVEGGDPRRLAALVAAAHARLAPRRLHALAVMVPRASPLPRALRGTWTHRTPLCLHTLALPGSPFADADFSTARPGLELALA